VRLKGREIRGKFKKNGKRRKNGRKMVEKW
jgi:hypothetical protein